mmetsp:Transcript_35102/g.90180  ORF Transcript_35102/g.90180 Transcript_35102/m.90180 type:complete len:205 (+) Transcript_35102:152-766(+)
MRWLSSRPRRSWRVSASPRWRALPWPVRTTSLMSGRRALRPIAPRMARILRSGCNATASSGPTASASGTATTTPTCARSCWTSSSTTACPLVATAWGSTRRSTTASGSRAASIAPSARWPRWSSRPDGGRTRRLSMPGARMARCAWRPLRRRLPRRPPSRCGRTSAPAWCARSPSKAGGRSTSRRSLAARCMLAASSAARAAAS